MDWKKIGNYALYVMPGYGLYDQFVRKHKGERNVLGVIGATVSAGFLVAKLVAFPAYVSKGVATGNWHPFKFEEKEKIEQSNDNKKTLEGCFEYKEILDNQ